VIENLERISFSIFNVSFGEISPIKKNSFKGLLMNVDWFLVSKKPLITILIGF
jgi:hypothetical protein